MKLKRYIAAELRRLRGDLKRKDLAALAKERGLGRSESHFAHLESGRNLPDEEELKALFDVYGIPERVPDFRKIVEAARKGHDWFTPYSGAAPAWFDYYLACEYSAARLDHFGTYVFHGLLQTRTYAEAIIRGGEPQLDGDQVAKRADLRQARQNLLHRSPTAPHTTFVIDESVLHRAPDDNINALAEQIEHILAVSDLPNVTIRLLPFSAGISHPGASGAFTILTFPPELVGDPGMAYIDGRIEGTTYETADEVARWRQTYELIEVKALDTQATRTALAHRVKEIS